MTELGQGQGSVSIVELAMLPSLLVGPFILGLLRLKLWPFYTYIVWFETRCNCKFNFNVPTAQTGYALGQPLCIKQTTETRTCVDRPNVALQTTVWPDLRICCLQGVTNRDGQNQIEVECFANYYVKSLDYSVLAANRKTLCLKAYVQCTWPCYKRSFWSCIFPRL